MHRSWCVGWGKGTSWLASRGATGHVYVHTELHGTRGNHRRVARRRGDDADPASSASDHHAPCNTHDDTSDTATTSTNVHTSDTNLNPTDPST